MLNSSRPQWPSQQTPRITRFFMKRSGTAISVKVFVPSLTRKGIATEHQLHLFSNFTQYQIMTTIPIELVIYGHFSISYVINILLNLIFNFLFFFNFIRFSSLIFLGFLGLFWLFWFYVLCTFILVSFTFRTPF